MKRGAPPLEQTLDLARWAPSGDNTQPWRFEITGDLTVTIHGFDTRAHCVYDFAGHPSQISLGALLQTLEIAAGANGMHAEVSRRSGLPDTRPTFDVRLVATASPAASPLLASITRRTVQRRALRMTSLAAAARAQLDASVGADYRVLWLDTFAERMRVARLLFRSARIRLLMPEAYAVHRDAIEFGVQFSEDRIPDRAVGLDPLATAIMRWTMASWPRMRFFNSWLGGTVLPRIELDFIPGIACAAHFAIVAAKPASSIDDFVDAGRALQRFWLTAAACDLYMQPEMTPLIFSWYVNAEQRFSALPELWNDALELRGDLERLLGKDILSRAVFFGRIGAGSPPVARSLRLPLERLLVERGPAQC